MGYFMRCLFGEVGFCRKGCVLWEIGNRGFGCSFRGIWEFGGVREK